MGLPPEVSRGIAEQEHMLQLAFELSAICNFDFSLCLVRLLHAAKTITLLLTPELIPSYRHVFIRRCMR